MPATAILIHGCHLLADGWQSIVWGNPTDGVLGRIPRGLHLALNENAEFIIWGTGASERDGVRESRYTWNYAVAHMNELDESQGFDHSKIKALLDQSSILDDVTQNTSDEIANAVSLCQERGIRRLFLVSSPTHIARCLQEAEKFRAGGTMKGVEVLATASDVSFIGSTPGDVVIVEPPHRGDMPKWNTHRYVRAMFGIMREGNETFGNFLHEFADLLKKYGVEVNWPPTPPGD